MIATKAQRAAALGFGLACCLALPPADGNIGTDGAAASLGSYPFDVDAETPVGGLFDTKAKRASAIGFGGAAWSVLPPADGDIGTDGACRSLASYSFEPDPVVILIPIPTRCLMVDTFSTRLVMRDDLV